MADAFVVFANGLDELGVFPNRAKIAALAMIMKDCCDYAVGATTAASIWARAVSCVSPARRLAILYVADAAVRHERSESKARAKANASLDTLDTDEGTIETALNPIVCACLVHAYVGVRHEDQASMQRLATSWIQRNVFGCEAKRALASFPHVITTTPSLLSLRRK
jgi:CID domain